MTCFLCSFANDLIWQLPKSILFYLMSSWGCYSLKPHIDLKSDFIWSHSWIFSLSHQFYCPVSDLAIIVYGLLMKINVYEHFIRCPKRILTVLKIMPTLIGLMVAVGILRASGFLEMISSCIGQFTAAIGFPGELVPLTVVKCSLLSRNRTSSGSL